MAGQYDDAVLQAWVDAVRNNGVKNSMNKFIGDGVKTVYDINFAGGYLNKADILAYKISPTNAKTDVVVTAVNDNKVTIDAPVAAGWTLVIYRDTPKSFPLVDFADNSIINEKNLDTNFKQTVFGVAELLDRFDETVTFTLDAYAAAERAKNSENAAAASAAAAATSAASALSSANTASASATAVAADRVAVSSAAQQVAANTVSAAASAGTAVQAANTAAGAAESALASATSATASAASAASSAALAPNLGPQGITLADKVITGFSATGLQNSAWVHFAGRDAVGDGGGGPFWFSSTSTQPADGGTVFAPAGGGRLFRQGWTVFGFNGPASVKYFGCKGDGTTIDTDAYRRAISSPFARSLYMPSGTYLIAPTATSGDFMLYLGTQDGRTIYGDGPGKTVIKLANNVGRAPLLFAGASTDTLKNIEFKDFTIDLNGLNNRQASYNDPLRYNAAFYLFCYCENITFRNLRFKDGAGSQLIRVGNDTPEGYGRNIKLLDSVFENFGVGVPGNMQQDCSAVYIQADGIVAQMNRFENPDFSFDLARGHTALELHCDSSTQVMLNTFKHVQLPVLLASSLKPFTNVQVNFNTYWQCNYMVSLDPSALDQKNVQICWNTYFSTKVSSSAIVPIGMPNEAAKNREEIEFSNNTLTGWGNVNQRTHVFSCVNNYIRSLKVSGNTVSGFNGSLLYVAGEVKNSGYVDFTLKNNKLDSLGATSGDYPNSPAFVHVETSSGVIKALSIVGTTLFNSQGKNYGAFGAFKLSGAIAHVTVTGTEHNLSQAYPVVTEAITASVVKNLESSIERPVDYRSGFVALPANSSVNLFDFTAFTQNENAILDIDLWVSVGGSSNGSALSYKVLVGSSVKVATQVAKGGTYSNDVVVDFSGPVLRVTSSTGTSLSMLVNIRGISTKPIAWLI